MENRSRLSARLTDANGGVAQTRHPAFVESFVPLERPCLIRVVKEILPIVRNRLSVAVDQNGRVVVFRASGPLVGHINLFRVAHDDVAVVLQGGGASP